MYVFECLYFTEPALKPHANAMRGHVDFMNFSGDLWTN